MVSTNDNWVRIFDIPETSKHKRGFTIYKVISMLYPSTCPDAITKITVWKRYNDFKRLHREMKVLHKKLCMTDAFPGLQNTSFFRRFDEEVVEGRRQTVLNLLEYLGQHFQLFTSREFIKFFESSHVPGDQMDGNINSIKAELNLPSEPEYVSFLTPNSDDEHTSDTDSMSTLSSLSTSFQVLDFLSDTNRNSITKSSIKSTETGSASGTMQVEPRNPLDGHIYPTPPNTPSSTPTDNELKYIMEATVYADMAVDFEKSGHYEDAFISYKKSIDILLKNVKGDKDVSRRTSVRYQTEKYLLRAEKLYNMYLSPEMRSFHELTHVDRECTVERNISDLYKYKVVKVIGSGMLTLHAELQQLFFVKVVRKTVAFSKKHLILPESVPYMVKLYNYHDCENALFLILHYNSGISLWEYVKQNFSSKVPSLQDLEASIETGSCDVSDNESEFSYSDLITEYTASKIKPDLVKNPGVIENTKENPATPSQDFDLVTVEKASEEAGWGSENFNSSGGALVPKKYVVKWGAQLLLALEKLHSVGLICCDLRCENLMIDDAGDLVLTYVCSLREMNDVCVNRKFLHLPPEVHSFQKITKAVDWWNYGIILYELVVGMPLEMIHPEGLSNYTALKMPKHVFPEAKSLLRQLLVTEPHERLGVNGVENLKSHPFFNSISWDSLLLKWKSQSV